MEYDKIILVGFVVLVLLWGASSYPFSSEPETPKYTAEIEMQNDDKIMVKTTNHAKVNADKLRVEFDYSLLSIKISNRSGIMDDAIGKDVFEYDPTKTFEGDFYSISGGKNGIPTCDIEVRVYYSYEDQDKLIKEEIIEYKNPSVPFSTESPEYVAEIEMQNDDKIMVKTINHAKVNANKLRVEFDCPQSSINISNRSGIVGDMSIGAKSVKYVFECDPTKTFEGDFYSISGGGKGVPIYDIHICVNYSYEGQAELIKKEIKYKNPNR